jgi:hypothetical protein
MSWSTSGADEPLSEKLDPFNASDTTAASQIDGSAHSDEPVEPKKPAKGKKAQAADAGTDGASAVIVPIGLSGAAAATVHANGPVWPMPTADSGVADSPAATVPAPGAPWSADAAVIKTPPNPSTELDTANTAVIKTPSHPTELDTADAPVKPLTAAPVSVEERPAIDQSQWPGMATTVDQASERQSGGEPARKPAEAETLDPAILPDPSVADSKDSRGGVAASLADEPWTAERTVALLTQRAIAQGSDPYEVLAVARCETGYTFMPWRDNGYLRRGALGEVGVAQWLPPVQSTHWGRTPHWREYGYNIEVGYLSGDPSAIWWDADALAWSMGPAAPAGFRAGWSCWRNRGPWWFV